MTINVPPFTIAIFFVCLAIVIAFNVRSYRKGYTCGYKHGRVLGASERSLTEAHARHDATEHLSERFRDMRPESKVIALYGVSVYCDAREKRLKELLTGQEAK